MAMDYLQKSAEILTGTGFEGDVPFMYRDTEGYVTVGVGQMIPDVNAAKKYPFLTPLGAKAAAEEIETDYKRVKAIPAGLKAEKYRSQSSLVLSQEYIRSILVKTLKECDVSLRRHYLRYDTYPEPVKLALLDMIYNLGAPKLFGQFPALEKAVNAQDWKTAAGQSHRKHKGATDNRNAWTRHQFLISDMKRPIPDLPVHPAHNDAPAMLPQKGL
jgi:GH24 family phage-related lysozyme (muramidase)